MDREKNSDLHDRLLKTRRLHVRVRITGNATPANKTHTPEMPSLVKIKTEGKDDVTGTDSAASTDMGAKVDANGTVGVLLVGGDDGIGNVDRALGSTVTPTDGGTCTVASVNTGTTAYGKTASGNIALNLDSSLSLAATDVDVTITIDYTRAPN
jgi:hypothetical protein